MFSEKNIQIPARSKVPATKLYCKIAQKESMNLGDRPVMILVPGGPGGNHSVYLPIVNQLLQFADLVLFDPRGCGNSEPSEAKYCTIDHYIDDIEAIRFYFNLDKIILLGGSYGSMASLGYAIKYPAHLEKLILLAGAPSYKFIETAKKNLERKGTDQQKKAAQKLWNGTFRNAKEFSDFYKIMAPLYSVNSVSAPPTTSSGIPYNVEVTNLGFSNFLRTFNYENEIEKITCSTLVIWGEDDWINDVYYAKFIASKIRGSTLHIFENCGHFAEEDQPTLFFNALADFFRDSNQPHSSST